MMKPKSNQESAFTLVELILGMTIMALVVTSVYTTMQVGMEAFHQGQATMELYQSGRIGLRHVASELSLALSPYSFWRPQDNYTQRRYEDVLANFGGLIVQEEDPGAIRFMGESDSVLFVRKVYRLNRYPPFDLEECRILVNSETEQLVLEQTRSLLAVKQACWYYQTLFKVNLAGSVMPYEGGRVRVRPLSPLENTPLPEFIGDYGVVNHVEVLADKIKEIKFRYSDGEGWMSHWDSQQLVTKYRISPQSPSFNQASDSFMRDKGPPRVVEISLKLENGDTLATATEVAAGNMNSLGIGNMGQMPPPTGPIQRPVGETPAAMPRS